MPPRRTYRLNEPAPLDDVSAAATGPFSLPEVAAAAAAAAAAPDGAPPGPGPLLGPPPAPLGPAAPPGPPRWDGEPRDHTAWAATALLIAFLAMKCA